MKFQYVTGEFPTKRGDPPPKKRSAPEPGKVGANQVQIKKFKRVRCPTVRRSPNKDELDREPWICKHLTDCAPSRRRHKGLASPLGVKKTFTIFN